MVGDGPDSAATHGGVHQCPTRTFLRVPLAHPYPEPGRAACRATLGQAVSRHGPTVVPVGEEAGARSLKTAATVLRALRLLGDHPAGLFPADLALHLGKSPATARYMVNTLCEAGYAERAGDGRCRLCVAPPWGAWGPDGDDLGPGDPAADSLLAEAVTDLYRRTRQRAYLVRRSGSVLATVADVRGHQGLARLPGLEDHVPPRQAHALALTQVLLAASPTYREALAGERLAALTPHTITSVPDLHRELAEVARRGWAVEDGQFASGFATLAAPVAAPSGTFTVALGLSCSSRRLEAEGPGLVEAVVAGAAAAREAWADAAERRDMSVVTRVPGVVPAVRSVGATGAARAVGCALSARRR